MANNKLIHLRSTKRFFNFLGSILCGLLLLVIPILSHADRLEANENNNENSAGELLLKNKQGAVVNTLLLDTDIDVNVSGLIATIKIKQTFRNDSDDWVNGRYVFPLPEGGAIDGMTMKIGERVIKGEIKEKQAAKTIFTEAKRAGKKASLLEQHRPNLFSMSVANIPPQSEVEAEIHVIDRVKYDQHIFSLRLPTTLTPRYTPGKKLQINLEEIKDVPINEQSGWGVNTNIVPDANEITPPQVHTQDTQTPNGFRFRLNLDAGIALERIHSETHEVKVTQSSNKQTLVSLKNTTEPMNRDLVLQWQPIKTNAPTAALFQQTIQQEHFVMAMLLPPTANIKNALPRDITFIIDSSGSMSGDSMRKAKKSLIYALQQLNSNDQFNVIDFDSQFTPFYSKSVEANQSNIDHAKRRVRKLHADGGTEMFGPLFFALDTPAEEHRLKQIIFITDGAVSNEQQLFNLIHNKLGDARLFTVGIGHAPNSHFMNRAAQFGRGSFTYIDTNSDSTEKMNRLFKKINHPIARDIQVNYTSSDAESIEQFPAKISDLYAGEPLVIFSKSKQSIDSIDISGNLLGNPWQRSLKAAKNAKDTNNIDALWARKKVAHLMDQLHTQILPETIVKPKIIELGIRHHLLTKYTSFVAVENEPSKPLNVETKDKKIPNLMPKGSTMPVPQTATTAGQLSLVGSLLMLLAMLLGHKGFRESLFGWVVKTKEGDNQYVA